MFETISRSWKLVGESFRVLEEDKNLLLFPLCAGIASIFVVAIFFIALVGTTFTAPKLPVGNFSWVFYLVWLYLLFLAISFIASYFSAGLIAASNITLRGGNSKFSDGIAAASKHIHKIFIWSVIEATVNLIFSGFRSRRNIIVNLIGGFMQTAWEWITVFVIPVIVLEDKDMKDSMKRSVQLFKNAWGETIVGQFSIGAIFGVLFLVGFVVFLGTLFLGFFAATLIVLVGFIIYAVVLSVIASALGGIYKTALYNYAIGKKIKFSDEFLVDAYKKTK